MFPITQAISLAVGHASFTLCALSGVRVIDIAAESIMNSSTTSHWEGIKPIFLREL